MKTSITTLIEQEASDVSGGTFASKTKEAGIFLVNVAAPFVGFGLGVGIFFLLTKEVKERAM